MVETWLKPHVSNNLLNLPDYTIFRKDRNLIHPATGRFVQGGGVACCIRKRMLKAQVLHSSFLDDINTPEFLILDVTLADGTHLLLASVYRRPNGHTLHNFFNVFANYSANFSNMIIAGDLNCNLLETGWAANHLKTFIYESSLYCIPYNTTHRCGHGDSWLDVIILDAASKLISFHKSEAPFIAGHDYLFCVSRKLPKASWKAYYLQKF